MSVLPTPHQTLLRVVALGIATTVAAFLLLASLLVH
jgi:hypothetical protein